MSGWIKILLFMVVGAVVGWVVSKYLDRKFSSSGSVNVDIGEPYIISQK